MGISYIGASKEKLGGAACCAVKRIHLDARIAKRAAAAGADLKEGFEVCVLGPPGVLVAAVPWGLQDGAAPASSQQPHPSGSTHHTAALCPVLLPT
jgi:hypothetical protein